jgi:hypothetical protein
MDFIMFLKKIAALTVVFLSMSRRLNLIEKNLSTRNNLFTAARTSGNADRSPLSDMGNRAAEYIQAIRLK